MNPLWNIIGDFDNRIFRSRLKMMSHCERVSKKNYPANVYDPQTVKTTGQMVPKAKKLLYRRAIFVTSEIGHRFLKFHPPKNNSAGWEKSFLISKKRQESFNRIIGHLTRNLYIVKEGKRDIKRREGRKA